MTAAANDLLVEVGTEELPPSSLSTLAKAFHDSLLERLGESRLSHGSGTTYASPRRLAVIVEQVAIVQSDETVVRRGPAVRAAFDSDGYPTKAALGFARSCGVGVEALGREETDKGSWLSFEQHSAGKPTSELLAGLIERALGDLPISKRMRWGDRDIEFVRPAHWVCVRFGAEPVHGTVLGLSIGDMTRGHRFHDPEPRLVASPSAYADTLRDAFVEVDIDARRASIKGQVEDLASDAGGRALIDEGVLDEVTALCEWPVALLGSFDPMFLEVPSEVLIETMQKNQKYFPVMDTSGRLSPSFIAVSNIKSTQPAEVRAGNERVIRPRFADAKFFWEQDLKTPLPDHREALKGIVFQHQLGSMHAKSERLAAVSGWIAQETQSNRAEAERAARLAKCDLVTLMVGEFGSLQGVMGRYYADAAGEPSSVCAAIEQHYWPKHAGDQLPQDATGRAVALADRVDTLLGIFSIGGRPTGVKDPYGLRRAAIAVLRILIETPLSLDLKTLLERAADSYPGDVGAGEHVDEVFQYCMERLKRYYSDTDDRRSASADVVASVLALGRTEPVDIDRRIQAVQRFRGRREAGVLASANKRTRNILRKVTDGQSRDTVDPSRLEDAAEVSLVELLAVKTQRVDFLLKSADYDGILGELSGMGDALDQFFEEVMVMADDPELRANRLAILQNIEALFLNVADLSLLQA